ncbi:MAG: RNA polymerase sigma factor [Clostridia bacterium]|nr:RNA polymerase sigma factor [Clostridia bacterium]
MAKDRQPRDVTDEAVIERFFARDEQAIRDIEQKYGVYLRRLSYRILHDREDCEECVNDTCLALWNAIPPARPASLGAFVTAVARRIAVEKYRTRTRQKRVPSELTVSLDELFESETADTAVEDEAASAELAALLSEFVRGLPARDRYIFISRWYETCPVSDIASELSVTPSAVYKATDRIRADLKAYLERNGVYL